LTKSEMESLISLLILMDPWVENSIKNYKQLIQKKESKKSCHGK
jgi:hypothetical protein